jgi:hypothetical protein
MFRRLAIRHAALAAVSAAAMALPAAAQTNNPDFRLNNNSGQTVNEVFVSSSADQNWGRDRLGENVLPRGQSIMISLPAGQCVNDIRIIFADGRAQERRQVNTCSLTDINVQ